MSAQNIIDLAQTAAIIFLTLTWLVLQSGINGHLLTRVASLEAELKALKQNRRGIL